MEPKKRRRRPKYTLMIFSDKMEKEGVKQLYLGSKRVQIAAVVLGILLIADICYCVYNPILMSGVRNVNRSQAARIEQLMKEKETLEAEATDEESKAKIESTGDLYVSGNYILDKEQITFIYNKYDISYYAAGDIIVNVSYDKLKNLLK